MVVVMSKVEEVVLKCHNKLMESKGIDVKSSVDLEVRRRYGIDSLGIVTMIMEIEEMLEVELDDRLADIRKCRTIGEIVNVIESICED